MAESNQASVRFATETSWGETPSGVGATEARITSEAVEHAPNKIRSQEIRSDRQTAAIIEVGLAAQGPINFELEYGDHETFLTNALRNTISSAVVQNVSVVFAPNSFTVPAAVNLLDSFEAGQWVRVTDDGGATTASTAVQILTLTSTVASVNTGGFASSVTASATINGRTLKNGTTKSSFFLETSFGDITAVKYFNGMRINTMSMNVQSGQIVTGVFNFSGKQGFTASTTQTSTVTSAGTTTPMTAAVNVGTIRENGAALSNAVQAFTMNLNNNMIQRPQVGSKTTANPGDGSLAVDGVLTLYLEDITHFQRMIDDTVTDLSMRFTDDADNMIILTLPSIKFTGGTPPVSGLDQDIFLPLNYQAFKDATTGETVRLDFLPAF